MRTSGTGKPNPALCDIIIGRVTRTHVDSTLRHDHVWIADAAWSPDVSWQEVQGYAALLCRRAMSHALAASCPMPLVSEFDSTHLNDGDVVALNRTGYVRTLYRVGSPHNAIFATEHCNSYCLMCSQPPRQVDESGRLARHLRLLELIPDVPSELGITGGEPTLLKDDLLTLIRTCKARFASTPLHVLSNGRLFYYGGLARNVAEIAHPDLMIGIPLYSDVDCDHDYVVQAKGAFDQTVVGLQNLGRWSVPVEVRIVIHRLTCERLRDIAEFIYRNMTFAAHVAFMGLELTGFTLPNIEQLWVDPWDYRAELERAMWCLIDRGMNVSVYNHQLCTVSEQLWPWCRRSISDWKNVYLPACETCHVRNRCGGFFASALGRRHSAHIRPLGA